MDKIILHDRVRDYLKPMATQKPEQDREVGVLRTAFSPNMARRVVEEDASVLKYQINHMFKVAREKYPNHGFNFQRPDGNYIFENDEGNYEVRLAIYDIPSGAV